MRACYYGKAFCSSRGKEGEGRREDGKRGEGKGFAGPTSNWFLHA